MSTNNTVGKPVSRIEGIEKVTGKAQYSGEYNPPGLLYGYVVNSTITRGKIISMDTDKVKLIPGVVEVFTHKNRPSLAWFDFQYADMDAPPGAVFKPLRSPEIKFNGQPIALVVAESFELSRYAACQLIVEYAEETFETDLEDNLHKARDAKKGLSSFLKPSPAKPTGDFNTAFNQSPIKVSSVFKHATEHHNPMEMFTTTTVYEGSGKLTIYDKTQGTINSQLYVANIFGLHFKDVRVLSTYVGGAFGSGLRPQYQLFLCVLASLQLKKNVRVTLDRKQMFTFGHRPQTIQTTKFSTDKNGKLTALHHAAFAETSRFEDYIENVVGWSHQLYPAANTEFKYQVVPLDLFTPLDMRAPGGCTGMHAIEVAMDELSYELNIDPLELRLRNYSSRNPADKKPFTSKELEQCYVKGAEKFGWSNRSPQPGSMSRGNKLVGYGMATGIWDAMQLPARAEAIISKEGKL
ncbi:MAG: molybdopterin cofactor-binding domain-containing protein, partial [Chitinophagaceae bacterium]